MDWIQGDKFIGIADFTYAPKQRVSDDYDTLANTLGEVKDYDTIYTHIMYAKGLFDVIKQMDRVVTVITHNSDMSIDESFTLPNNVTRWYSQNVDIVHPRIESIPIGIENNRWYPEKKSKMIKCLSTKRDHRNLAYINHNVSTHPERESIYRIHKHKPWIDSARGKNGRKFDEYLSNVYNHKFVFCPEGNGIDTHRTWECLYMGTIPIMKRNINNQFYTELPICFVDSWEDVTEDFLEGEYIKIKSGTWNTGMLNFAFWEHKIRKHGNI